MTAENNYRSGFAAIIGRPNVGKSTLLNLLIGHKISITSRKPQTTRHRIIGIRTTGSAQVAYVDTPGMHAGRTRALNRYLNRTADGALAGVDVIVLLIEALRWLDEDTSALAKADAGGVPVFVAVNKVDLINPKERLLPYLEEVAGRGRIEEIVPISARRDINVDRLQQLVEMRLPLGVPLFPPDQITDRSDRFLTAEVIREQLIRRVGQELPFRTTVEVERMVERHGRLVVGAIIWVESRSNKLIVIGHNASRLKQIGVDARKRLQGQLGRSVHLDLWVKIAQGWSNSDRALMRLGYHDSLG